MLDGACRKRYYWKVLLFGTSFLYILVSLTETPSFPNLPESTGKDWYELLLEVICNTIFAIDIYVQVRAAWL